VLVDLAVVGVGLPGRGAGVSEDQVAPAGAGQVAGVAGECGYLGGAHQCVEHAGVERDEPRSLAAADVAAGGEHAGDQCRAADRARVYGVIRCLRWRPVFGQVGFAQRVLVEPLLSYRVAKHAVKYPPPPGEIPGGGGLAVQVERQSVEHVADHGRVLEDGDRPGCPGYPHDGLGLVVVELGRVLALVEFLAQGVP